MSSAASSSAQYFDRFNPWRIACPTLRVLVPRQRVKITVAEVLGPVKAVKAIN
jgi:hypothetical protein